MRWTLLLVGLLTLGLAGCGDGSKGGCQGNEDCDEGQKCVDGACVVRCTCGPEEECTATAAECASDVKTDAADGDAVAPIPCTFDSDCNDGNDCTKDWCEGGFCKTRVFTAAEAVGCCTVLADCVDKSKPSASEADPDGDPCTVDSCTELHCLHEVEDPYCCHKDSDCTDENDCTQDKCVENKCLFSEPKPNCCAQDQDCKDDNPCTMDICIAGTCAHPGDSLKVECGCQSTVDCDDANPCTTDSCLSGQCVYDKAEAGDCCGATAECDDQDETTLDYCKMYTCVHQKQKTCFSDGECDDGNACTSDGCKETKCVHEHSDDPYCCMHDTECDDGNPCTEGKCVGNVCKYQILSDEGCCKTNMECDDGIGCTMDECADWTCKHTPVGAKCCTPETETIVCDDGNPCTIDQCINGLCQWQMVTTGCCEKDDDCMDCVDTVTGASCAVDHTVTPPQCKGESCLDNICTMHSCANKLCYYAPVSNCCLTDQDCKDEKECTLDSCGADHKCKHEFQESCCSNNGMCNDGNICTIDLCDIPAGSLVGTCKYQKKVPCCTSEVDCAPKTCKKTVCQNGNCIYLPLEDCCIHDEDCNDDDVCTIDKCLNNVCEHIPSGICG